MFSLRRACLQLCGAAARREATSANTLRPATKKQHCHSNVMSNPSIRYLMWMQLESTRTPSTLATCPRHKSNEYQRTRTVTQTRNAEWRDHCGNIALHVKQYTPTVNTLCSPSVSHGISDYTEGEWKKKGKTKWRGCKFTAPSMSNQNTHICTSEQHYPLHKCNIQQTSSHKKCISV